MIAGNKQGMAVKRDAKGRYLPGHSGNPNGRPRRSTEEAFLQKLRDNVDCQDFERMIAVALSRAKAGDYQFTRLLLQYLIGMPTQYVKQDMDIKAEVQTILTWPDGTVAEPP